MTRLDWLELWDELRVRMKFIRKICVPMLHRWALGLSMCLMLLLYIVLRALTSLDLIFVWLVCLILSGVLGWIIGGIDP